MHNLITTKVSLIYHWSTLVVCRSVLGVLHYSWLVFRLVLFVVSRSRSGVFSLSILNGGVRFRFNFVIGLGIVRSIGHSQYKATEEDD
jgi:hypothetical protein